MIHDVWAALVALWPLLLLLAVVAWVLWWVVGGVERHDRANCPVCSQRDQDAPI